MAKDKPIRPQLLPPIGQPLEFYPEDAILPPSNVREFRNFESKRNAQFEERWEGPRKKMFAKVHKNPEKMVKLYGDFDLERSKDWVKFANKTREIKDKYVALFVKQLKADELEAKDYQIPHKGRWITFPLCGSGDAEGDRVNGDPVTIAWTSANTTHTARYYKLTCWFGTLEYQPSPITDPTNPRPDPTKPPPDPPSLKDLLKVEPLDDDLDYDPDKDPGTEPKQPAEGSKEPGALPTDPAETVTTTPPVETSQPDASSMRRWEPVVQLNAFGETTLFIAAEFIEKRYQGAPHLRHLHLRDKFPPGTRWGYLRLDQAFHYGQNFDPPTYRYLVYHPFMRPRDIPQRSFADNIILTTALSIAEAASNSGNAYVAGGGAAIGGIVKLIGTCHLDPLRQFGPLDSEEMLYDVSKEIETRRKAWNPEPTLLQQTEQVLQISAQLATIDPNKAPTLETGPSEPLEGKQIGTEPEVTLRSPPEREGEKENFLAGAEELLAHAIDKMIEGVAIPNLSQNAATETYLDRRKEDKSEELVLPPYQGPVRQRRELAPRPLPGKNPKLPLKNTPESQTALQKIEHGSNTVQEQLGLRQSPSSEDSEPNPNPPPPERVGPAQWRVKSYGNVNGKKVVTKETWRYWR